MAFKSDRQRKAVMAQFNRDINRATPKFRGRPIPRDRNFQKVEQITDAFARGATGGKARADRSFPDGRVFIDGNVIYSFGFHFPMAIRLNNKEVILNKDKFSNTTSKQQSQLKRDLVSQGFRITEVSTSRLKSIIKLDEGM